MESSYIINTLKSTPYKFTFVSKVIDHLKKDPDGNADKIINDLRLSLTEPRNSDISKPVKEIVKYFMNYVV